MKRYVVTNRYKLVIHDHTTFSYYNVDYTICIISISIHVYDGPKGVWSLHVEGFNGLPY
jgi:hypothetical protein